MQIPLDFTGKCAHKITIAVDDDLKLILDNISRVCGKPVATVCKEYVADKAGGDWGKYIAKKAKGFAVDIDKL